VTSGHTIPSLATAKTLLLGWGKWYRAILNYSLVWSHTTYPIKAEGAEGFILLPSLGLYLITVLSRTVLAWSDRRCPYCARVQGPMITLIQLLLL
jgi:hypothetical protein